MMLQRPRRAVDQKHIDLAASEFFREARVPKLIYGLVSFERAMEELDGRIDTVQLCQFPGQCEILLLMANSDMSNPRLAEQLQDLPNYNC